jgi:uncharacterized protein YjbI with pentapeptide repeats
MVLGRSCKEDFGFVCKGLPADNEHEGKEYCVLHCPSVDKDQAEFEEAVEKKVKDKDFDFRGVYFPGWQSLAPFRISTLPNGTFEELADFSDATFKERAVFSRATFKKMAHFDRSTFVGEANFLNGTFEGLATFHDAIFKESATFSDATFKELATFHGAIFEGQAILESDRKAIFGYATFKGKADFSRATFKELADFSRATFEELADFDRATFEEVNFYRATFKGEADFSGATFEEVSFEDVTFEEEAYLDRTTFKREAYFRGPETFSRVADFQFARIEKPELFSFHRGRLRPSWFINVDPRRFDFTEVQWPGQPGGPKVTLDDEIRSLQNRNIQASYNPYILLAQACRRLSANAEDNREYPIANEFHYWSMDAVRKGSWNHLKDLSLRALLKKETWYDIGEHFDLITTLYWALSGYGVRATRAFWILFAIWLMFAALYFLLVKSSPFWVFAAPDIWQGIDYARQAAVYSLSALVRLNPRPQSEELNWFQTLVTVEGILGPLQIALLVLAIRRKVMR